jgi:hydrogenase maturation protease
VKKLVLGIGNPIVGDDGVGFRVIEALQSRPPQHDVILAASDVSGIAILDLIIGYDEVIIVDAIRTVDGRPGHVCRLTVDDFRVTRHATSPHDVDLPTALKMGSLLKLELPRKISIVAIETPDAFEFGTELTPAVRDALPAAVSMVSQILLE